MAQQSDIKSEAYSPSNVEALFEGFLRQADRSLLFLKSVRSTAVYIQSGSDEAPRLLFRAAINTQVQALHPSIAYDLQLSCFLVGGDATMLKNISRECRHILWKKKAVWELQSLTCGYVQDGVGSQAAICRFMGSGGKAEREAFYRRLAAISLAELPSAEAVVDVSIDNDSGDLKALFKTASTMEIE